MDSSLLLEQIQVWRGCTSMYPALGEGDGAGDTLPRYTQAQHPARQRGASQSCKLSYGISLKSENQVFKNKFRLRGAHPLTARHGRDRDPTGVDSGKAMGCRSWSGLPHLTGQMASFGDSTFFHVSILFTILLGERPHLENM